MFKLIVVPMDMIEPKKGGLVRKLFLHVKKSPALGALFLGMRYKRH